VLSNCVLTTLTKHIAWVPQTEYYNMVRKTYWRLGTRNRASLKAVSCVNVVLIALLGRHVRCAMVLRESVFAPLTKRIALIS